MQLKGSTTLITCFTSSTFPAKGCHYNYEQAVVVGFLITLQALVEARSSSLLADVYSY